MELFFRFIVFKNLWIALCAASMLYTTRFFFAIPIKIDALASFIFFSTFFEYNLHHHIWHYKSNPLQAVKKLFSPGVPATLRYCIIVGFTGTVVSFVSLDRKIIPVIFVFSVLTIAYSFPLIKWKQKFIRLREITYLKVFVVAFVWSFVTVIVPLTGLIHQLSTPEVVIIFLRRFIFIYAITIPFEIQGIENEKSFGNESLPMIYGIRSMKITGLTFMLLFCVLAAMHEKYFEFNIATRQHIFWPLILSAIFSGLLISFYSAKRSEWYNKFLVDGMMILQLLLLLIFNSGEA